MPDDESPKTVIVLDPVLEPREVIVLEEYDNGDDRDDDDCDNKYKRGDKRYFSRNSKRLGDIENRATDSLDRVANAVKHGVDAYTEKRNKSEKERCDGALVDFCVNAATGVSRTISESAPVLIDAAEAFTTNRRRKQLRRFVRSFPFPF